MPFLWISGGGLVVVVLAFVVREVCIEAVHDLYHAVRRRLRRRRHGPGDIA